MGSCISDINGTRRANNTTEKYDAEPSDTQSLLPADFPQLQIHTLLTKLKLKRCTQYRLLGIRIEFAGYEQFELKSKILVNDTARWDVQHLLDFNISEYQMRKKFIVLSIFDDLNKVIGSLRINLYHLATGPYHQDFSVPLPKAPGARLSFNLKIAQTIQIYLKINQTKVISKEREFPGDMFAFSIRSIIGDRIEETNPSYRYEVGFEKSKNQLGLQKNKEHNGNTANQKSSSLNKSNGVVENKREEDKKSKTPTLLPEQRGEVGHRELFWSSTQSNEMPELKASFPIYDLHCASFNIIFYYFTPSECYISLLKLSSFACKQRIDASTLIHWEDRNIQIEAKTFDHGRQSGKAKFNITFSIQKFIKQMQICVRTQKGILQSSPVFGESIGSLNVPAELKQLETLSNEIQNLFIEANRLHAKGQVKEGTQMQEVNKRLKRQKQILMNTSKQSKKMFVYQDQKALLNGQRQLIELGFKTRGLLSENRQQIAANCWQLLIALTKRGELTLSYIGFTKLQVGEYLSGKANQFLKRKKDVCLSYHRLIIDLLQITFQALQTFTCQNEKCFAELFCAYAYFRIPRFRNQVLSAITHTDDPQIQEWRGTQFNLTEDSTEMPIDGQNAFMVMFDWQNYFYKVLETEQQYLKIEDKLSQLLKDNDWEIRMRKRGGAFFAFVRYWVNYVETIAINSKHILWRYFPGYNKILLSFLAEMKSKNIEDYSESMRQAASSLLSNQKLLNPFVLIIFRKTNLNDRIEVFKTFDLLHIFFTSITNRGRSLPSTFDLKLLMKGIKSVLQGDSAFGIGKVLLLIYNHYKIFPVEFRIEVSIFLMTKVFFKLFQHWSLNVRTIFHHLLFIRIYHEASKPLAQLDPKDQQIYRANPDYRTEIISRYRKLIIILENAQQFSHKIHKTRIDIYEKETYKKMKKKINEKRRMTYNPQLDSAKSIKSKFKTERQYQYQLMTELAEPKLEKYNSQVISKSLQVVVENKKIVKKEEVIMKMKKQNKEEAKVIPRRKLSFFENSLESQLVAFKEDEIIYIRPSLQEFHKINQFFIKYVQKNKDSVPVVKLELPLDEKEIRPEGLSESDEW